MVLITPHAFFIKWRMSPRHSCFLIFFVLQVLLVFLWINSPKNQFWFRADWFIHTRRDKVACNPNLYRSGKFVTSKHPHFYASRAQSRNCFRNLILWEIKKVRFNGDLGVGFQLTKLTTGMIWMHEQTNQRSKNQRINETNERTKERRTIERSEEKPTKRTERNERTNEQTNEGRNEGMNERKNEHTKEHKNERKNKQTNEYSNEREPERLRVEEGITNFQISSKRVEGSSPNINFLQILRVFYIKSTRGNCQFSKLDDLLGDAQKVTTENTCSLSSMAVTPSRVRSFSSRSYTWDSFTCGDSNRD